MPMKNPPHPGLSIRHDCLEPLGLSVTEAAKKLGVSRKQLSDVVNGRSGISPQMAIRLDKAFDGDFLWRRRWYIRQVIFLYRLLIACFSRSTPVPCAATPSTR